MDDFTYIVLWLTTLLMLRGSLHYEKEVADLYFSPCLEDGHTQRYCYEKAIKEIEYINKLKQEREVG